MSDDQSDTEVREDDSLDNQFAAFVRQHRQHGWSDEVAETAQILSARISLCEIREQYLRSKLSFIRQDIDEALRRYM